MKRILPNIGNNLLLGTLLLAPLAITIWIVQKLFTFLTDWFVNFSPEVFKTGWRAIVARLVALFIVVVVVFLIGLLVKNFIGRRLYEWGDRILSRIPGVKLFYNFFRQIIEVFFANRDSSFKEVVLIEYPRAGAYTLGFVTSSVPQHISTHVASAIPNEECVSVFIPTTPNPTGGWLLIVPRSQVITLKMTPAEGMKLIVSGGAIFPGTKDAAKTSLLDKLELMVAEANVKA